MTLLRWAQVEQIREFAAQRGIPLKEDADDSGAFIESLMAWGDFEAVASWRGPDGIITQLTKLGSYGSLPREHLTKLSVWHLC